MNLRSVRLAFSEGWQAEERKTRSGFCGVNFTLFPRTSPVTGGRNIQRSLRILRIWLLLTRRKKDTDIFLFGGFPKFIERLLSPHHIFFLLIFLV